MDDRILTAAEIEAMAAAKAGERRARLEEIRRTALASGKEPFVYERVMKALEEDAWRFERLDHELREVELEEKYFVAYPEARTVDEFIRRYEQTEYW